MGSAANLAAQLHDMAPPALEDPYSTIAQFQNGGPAAWARLAPGTQAAVEVAMARLWAATVCGGGGGEGGLAAVLWPAIVQAGLEHERASRRGRRAAWDRNLMNHRQLTNATSPV